MASHPQPHPKVVCEFEAILKIPSEDETVDGGVDARCPKIQIRKNHACRVDGAGGGDNTWGSFEGVGPRFSPEYRSHARNSANILQRLLSDRSDDLIAYWL